MVLPYWGGTSAVWNTCMFFFQLVLLAGYYYVHKITRITGLKKSLIIHIFILLIPIIVLPLAINNFIPENTSNFQNLRLLFQLFMVAGIPVFAVSCNAPLIQKIFAELSENASANPYILYSASNAGSFLALIIYPIIIEPVFTLKNQNLLWSFIFLLYILLFFYIIFKFWKKKGNVIVQNTTAPCDIEKNLNLHSKLKIITMAFIPSSLMLGVTAHITTDFTPVPLLWILPLALYLLTYIISFSGKYSSKMLWITKFLPYIVLPVVLFNFTELKQMNWILIPVHLSLFFLLALLCHNKLYSLRPDSKFLTDYYLSISVGGVLGGLFNSVLAIAIFNSVAEYPILIIIALIFRNSHEKNYKNRLLDIVLPALMLIAGIFIIKLILHTGINDKTVIFMLLFGIPTVACFAAKDYPLRFALCVGTLFIVLPLWISENDGQVIYRSRNFFSVKRIEKAKNNYHIFIHGNTWHGVQDQQISNNSVPGIYYHPKGPLGDIFSLIRNQKKIFDVGVIGLGVGAMAYYGNKGEQWKFYEIDPDVIDIALNPDFFSFVKKSNANIKLIQGDGRLCIKKEKNHYFDIIILDAFSSDSIPSHLITLEAIELYKKKLKPGGIIIFHISNRFLNIEPLLAALSEKVNLKFICRFEVALNEEDNKEYRVAANYAVMSQDEIFIGSLSEIDEWRSLKPSDNFKIWTDQYSNLLSILRWSE